jgi:hypothetical protein
MTENTNTPIDPAVLEEETRYVEQRRQAIRLHALAPDIFKDPFRNSNPSRASVPDPSDQRALDELAKREQENQAREQAERERGEQSWKDLEARTNEQQTPTAPNGYSLTLPEDLPREMVTEETTALLGDVAGFAHEAGVAVGEAQRLVEQYVSFAMSGRMSANLDNEDTCRGVIRSLWGKQYDANLMKVQQTVEKLGPKFSAWLNGTGLGNDPAMLQTLLHYASGGTRMSKAAAEKELAAIKADKTHPYWRGDKAATVRVNVLYDAIGASE